MPYACNIRTFFYHTRGPGLPQKKFWNLVHKSIQKYFLL